MDVKCVDTSARSEVNDSRSVLLEKRGGCGFGVLLIVFDWKVLPCS